MYAALEKWLTERLGFALVAKSSASFLSGGGEMGRLMRSHDWADSPMGAPETWPQSLRLTVRLLLNTRHPMFIWWGTDLIQFYNDGYRETMGPERHPSALGDRGKDCWQEIWPIIGPQIESVLAGNGSTWDEDRLVPITRNGAREDVWWTYSYSPIDLEGKIGGVLVICNDITKHHLAAARVKAEAQRLNMLFHQAPGFMAVLRGSNHVFELTNSAFVRLVGSRPLVGRSVHEAIPEAAEQGFVELLNTVFTTGIAHVGRRVPMELIGKDNLPSRSLVVDFVYQPIIEDDGSVSGIFVEGIDVTDHVKSEEHLIFLNEELRHRVKNTLAIVSAIATQTLRGQEHDAQLAAFRGRLVAFGRAHDILTLSSTGEVSLYDVVSGAIAAHQSAGRISFKGPALDLGPKQALSLTLAINELATNATKYGSLSAQSGNVSISWNVLREEGGQIFKFLWQESGGPHVQEPSKLGFGTKMINTVLTDFNGRVDLRYASEGIELSLISSVENLKARMTTSMTGTS
ncbi:sensor histidine kinase [Kaistia terrae]|uniref:Blue-light-activated histidine kinase n=1 Tax=Kaistia terrae TaxID=537017 RepID=A0ABW0Q3V9_9HYPH|nr:HWE histidine kinase domain-containing protein [Kaistia terrae]MCX5581593.1 PAS domain-containing protein [Kaistia terrae]